MGYCADHGLPHSEYLERWSATDRAKLVAYLMEKGERCQMCGTAPWEWDPDQGGHKFAYEPAREVCMGCQKKDLLRDDQEKPPAGSSVVLIPRAVAKARRAAEAAKK